MINARALYLTGLSSQTRMAVAIAVTKPAPLARAILVKDPSSTSSLRCPSVYLCHCNPKRKELPLPPNALRRKIDPNWRGGFSLGIDLGLSRTGVALSKGFCFRPLTVNSNVWLFSL